jgi:hypothetical protein
MMKLWQTSKNKAPSKREKARGQNPKWVTQGQMNKSCSKAHSHEAYKIEKGMGYLIKKKKSRRVLTCNKNRNGL